MGATRKLYDEDSELYVFCAQVLACDGEGDRWAVILDQTAFFPEGGGQYADRGSLGGLAVTDVQEREQGIVHYLDSPLPVGTVVEGRVDGDTRFDRMQNHTGEHILSGLIHAAYGYHNVGFHLNDQEMTMDTDGELTPEQLTQLECQANEAVWRDTAVTATYPDPDTLATMTYRTKIRLEGKVRIVSIEGVDACACCAPHVKRTGQVGLIKIVAAIRYKGGMRLWVKCGRRALGDYRAKHDDILAVTQRHSVKPWQLVSLVDKMDEDVQSARAATAAAHRALADARLAAAMPDAKGNLVLFVDPAETDAGAHKLMADHGADRASGVCAVLVGGEREWRYICASRAVPLRELGKRMNSALGGRGGGNDAMIQGSLAASREEVEAFFDTI